VLTGKHLAGELMTKEAIPNRLALFVEVEPPAHLR
jgi:hypothetical protein